MEIAFVIGRIVLGVYFLFNAYNHFSQVKTMVPYAKSQGVPLADIAVPGSGILLVLGGISFLTGLYPTIGVIAVVLFLVPVAFMMHRFWGVDKQTMMMQMPNFLKNLALAASALMFLAIPQPWLFSLSF
jgi:uncharacterized membrane protein YphA (DoxX/SURF4 family)